MKRNFEYDENYEVESNNPEPSLIEEEFGCKFCYDKRKKKDKELFFLDHANNMRICNYCPYCGRKY